MMTAIALLIKFGPFIAYALLAIVAGLKLMMGL